MKSILICAVSGVGLLFSGALVSAQPENTMFDRASVAPLGHSVLETQSRLDRGSLSDSTFALPARVGGGYAIFDERRLSEPSPARDDWRDIGVSDSGFDERDIVVRQTPLRWKYAPDAGGFSLGADLKSGSREYPEEPHESGISAYYRDKPDVRSFRYDFPVLEGLELRGRYSGADEHDAVRCMAIGCELPGGRPQLQDIDEPGADQKRKKVLLPDTRTEEEKRLAELLSRLKMSPAPKPRVKPKTEREAWDKFRKLLSDHADGGATIEEVEQAKRDLDELRESWK